ncbi:PASTA domain-containing protein [Ruminococcus sp.]|uniref:PASTA domain-containing protein n=1 Tax=Ruminococcus sp. TaxID=41978 RepID=UPI0025F61BF0|nr:PASTA domain-containing protein [Ruminococcus sp.]
MKMTEIMAQAHQQNKASGLEKLMQKIDSKAFITSTTSEIIDDTPLPQKSQKIKVKKNKTSAVIIAACAALVVGAFSFSQLLNSDIPDIADSSKASAAAAPTDDQFFTIPNMKNMSADSVKQLVTKAGGVAVIREIYDDNVEAGNVVKTDPSANSVVPQGDIVTIYVSKGALTETNSEAEVENKNDVSIPIDLENDQRQTALENASDTAVIQSILNAKSAEFGILSIENCVDYLDVVAGTSDNVLRIKAYLEAYGVDPALCDVHTYYKEPSGDLTVSDEPVTSLKSIQNIVKKLADKGYQPKYTSCAISETEGVCLIGVAYEHNINEMKALLSACNVDLSYVEIKIDSLVANADIDMQAIAKELDENKTAYNIANVEYIYPETAAWVEAIKIDFSNSEKFSDLIDHVSHKYGDIFSQMPFSIGGGDYYFYG